jgi:eukaryotic-like serine/threonine-protein kinase
MQDAEASGLIGQSLGQYRLSGLLGVGGMAAVYRALDPALEREVAVKALPASLATDAEYVRRFRDEAKQVAALHHPHIVPIYAVGEERGYLYHVMPVLQGSLYDLLRQQGHLSSDEAIRLAQQIASALGAAHEVGLVHRDVKPENILFDAEGNGLLTDFGIARRFAARQGGGAPTLANTGLPVGTPQYMAPEQLRGEDLDQRADVYALGAVLYELLTGVAPHVADSPFEVASLALSAPILPPSQRNPQVWPELERVVLKSLAREATNRYPDMRSFSAALELALRRHAAHSTAAPQTPLKVRRFGARLLAPLREMGGKWTRQTGVIALAVLLLVGAAGGTALVMARGGATSGATSSAPTSGATASVTQPSGTVGVIATATPPAQPSLTPAPRPSPTPSPTLIVQPTPLVLQPGVPTDTCFGTQTITNTTDQTVGWQWLQPQGGFHFQVNGGPDQGWPKNLQPGIPPHGTDTLTASSHCQSQPKFYGILLADSLGGQYTFVLQLQ